MPPTHPQDDSDGSIECVNEERRLHKKVCNVSYPFFRAKAKVEAGGSVWAGRDGAGTGRYWGGTGEAREMEVNRGDNTGGMEKPEHGFEVCSFFLPGNDSHMT